MKNNKFPEDFLSAMHKAGITKKGLNEAWRLWCLFDNIFNRSTTLTYDYTLLAESVLKAKFSHLMLVEGLKTLKGTK